MPVAPADSLIYSTILGGSGLDYCYEVASDESGCAYVVGLTDSGNFPTKNNFLPFFWGDNGFISKISPYGDSLIYSIYLAGSAHDLALGVAVVNGKAIVAGETSSANFPQVSPFQLRRGDDGSVTKFSAGGDALLYSTYLGGHDWERIYAVAADSAGSVYLAGMTNSLDFPTLNELQLAQGNFDVFVAKLSDEFLCGDTDGSNEVSLTDIVFLINYIFSGGATSNPLSAGDANCSGAVTISDVVYLINYIFSGGSVPCGECR